MKNNIQFLIIISILLPLRFQAQCIDTVGINPPQFQSNYLILSGWQVNELPYAETRLEINRYGNNIFNIGPWEVAGYYFVPDSCTGGLFVHLIDTNTIAPDEIIEYRVYMRTQDGTEYFSPVASALDRRYRSIPLEFIRSLPTQRVITTTGDSEMIIEDVSEMSDRNGFRKVNVAIEYLPSHALRISNQDHEYSKVIITDISGRIIYSAGCNSSTDTIDLSSEILTGLYIVSVFTPDGRVTKKMFIK